MLPGRDGVLKHHSFYIVFLAHLLCFGCQIASCDGYFANWGDVGRSQEPTCVDIPANISLCSNIQYKRMRLPNLLAHDTLAEVAHQSSSWVPLLNVRCHPDTQLFLCSLFTPVCLESPIYPCRSLCTAVQEACEKRMTTYGYHWPDMLGCDNFPEDNDMCVMPLHTGPRSEIQDKTESPETDEGIVESAECEVCNPVSTYENILDHFCRADFVLRVRVRNIRNGRLVARKARVYKPALTAGSEDQATLRAKKQALRKPDLLLLNEASCCSSVLSKPNGRYLIMGRNSSEGLIPTFVLPWTRQKSVRDAVRVFGAGFDCNDPSLFTPDQESGAILNTASVARVRPAGGEGRRGGGGGGRRGNRRNKKRGKKRRQGDRSGKRVKQRRRDRENRRNGGNQTGETTSLKQGKRRNRNRARKMKVHKETAMGQTQNPIE